MWFHWVGGEILSNSNESLKDCLAAACTLLIEHGIADMDKVSEAFKDGNESIFKYLNDLYEGLNK